METTPVENNNPEPVDSTVSSPEKKGAASKKTKRVRKRKEKTEASSSAPVTSTPNPVGPQFGPSVPIPENPFQLKIEGRAPTRNEQFLARVSNLIHSHNVSLTQEISQHFAEENMRQQAFQKQFFFYCLQYIEKTMQNLATSLENSPSFTAPNEKIEEILKTATGKQLEEHLNEAISIQQAQHKAVLIELFRQVFRDIITPKLENMCHSVQDQMTNTFEQGIEHSLGTFLRNLEKELNQKNIHLTPTESKQLQSLNASVNNLTLIARQMSHNIVKIQNNFVENGGAFDRVDFGSVPEKGTMAWVNFYLPK